SEISWRLPVERRSAVSASRLSTKMRCVSCHWRCGSDPFHWRGEPMSTPRAPLQRPGARMGFGSRWAALLAGGLLLLVGASRAEAAGISIVNVSSTGSSTSDLAVGDILTVELVANNDTHLEIWGFGLIAWGYDVDSNGVADDG